MISARSSAKCLLLSSALAAISAKLAPRTAAASVCAAASGCTASRELPITSTGMPSAATSLSETPGPSAAMSASTCAKACGIRPVEIAEQRGEIVGRLAAGAARPCRDCAKMPRAWSAAMAEDECGDLGDRPHVHRRRRRTVHAGRTSTSAGDAVRMAAGEAQRDRRAHRDAAGDETLEAGLIGGGEHIVGEHLRRKTAACCRAPKRLAPRHSSVSAREDRSGKVLRHLRLVAAQPVLEDDRQPVARCRKPEAWRRRGAGSSGAAITAALQETATPGASSAESPCVTSGPSKPAASSRAMKSGSRRHPAPAVAKRPSA